MAVYQSKKKTRDGRSWFFRIKYKDIQGEIHDYTSPKFKNKRDAENEEARYRIKVDNKEAFVSNVTLKQVYLEFELEKANKVKKQTLEKDKNKYYFFSKIENIKINDINLKKYKELFLSNIDENLSTNYKNKILGLFRNLIKYSNKYYNTSDSILKYIENFKDINKIKKEMNFFTLDEYMDFDKVIDDFEYHVFFEILYYMGLRQGEAQALTWKDIDFNSNKLKISKTLTTKIKGEKYTISSPKTKNSNRILPMIKKIVDDLKILYKRYSCYKDFKDNWFVFGGPTPFVESSIQLRKNKYCSLTPSKKQIRVHDFRHSCASLLINQGASIALVSKYLGHSNITITLNTYTHLYKSELDNLVNVLNSAEK